MRRNAAALPDRQRQMHRIASSLIRKVACHFWAVSGYSEADVTGPMSQVLP